MKLSFVRIQRCWRLSLALTTISLAIVLHSCTADDSPIDDSLQVQNIHRLNVVDEDAQSSNQPLSSVLDLDYHADESLWTWRNVLLSRLRHHQFEDIDEFADGVRETRARFPGGGWKLFHIYDEMNAPSAGTDVTEEEWQAHLKLFEDWIEKYPNSPTARAAYADTWVRYAWHARGSGPARDVTPTQRRLFEERLKRAKEIVVDAFRLPVRCPHLYSVLLAVGQGEGWSRKEYDQLFEAAIAFEPFYRSFYHQKASYLQPRWYGREGDWQAFAQESADRIGGDAGADMFFFIYTDMASYYYGENDLPELVRPVWNRLKDGFDARERLHGVTADQRTVFGHYAYLAGDRAAVQTVLDSLGTQWNQGLWGSLQRERLIAWADLRDKHSN